MITSQQLRDRLNAMPNIRAVARLAGVSDKTLYRTAHGLTEPSLKNARLILDAIAAIEKRKAKAAQ